MKKGYKYAIEVLLEEYLSAEKKHEKDEAKIQQLREGIEYLCYPWREDLSEHVRSPLCEEGEKSLFYDEEEVRRRGIIHVEMSDYAWEVLKKIGSV